MILPTFDAQNRKTKVQVSDTTMLNRIAKARYLKK